jgi:hypothetical protein
MPCYLFPISFTFICLFWVSVIYVCSFSHFDFIHGIYYLQFAIPKLFSSLSLFKSAVFRNTGQSVILVLCFVWASLLSIVPPSPMTYWLHGAEPFLTDRHLCSHSRAHQNFMEPKGSFLRSQKPSAGRHLESDEYNMYNPILSTYDPS